MFEDIFNIKVPSILILVVVIIILLSIFCVVKGKKRKENRKKHQQIDYRESGNYSLNDCKSLEDIEFKVDTYQSNLNRELVKNKHIINEAKRKGYIKASTAWTDRFQEFTNISNTLYKNLEYENAKKLSIDKFHRYTSLHYRSVILGNIAYKDYCDSKKVRDEISELLVAIGKKQVKVTSSEKRELYDIKDTCKDTTKYLYDRMIAIQNKTATLRDKIRDECGNRGREWYNKIMRNR